MFLKFLLSGFKWLKTGFVFFLTASVIDVHASDLSFQASFIYWQVQADGLPVINTEIEDAAGIDVDNILHDSGFQWDPGFKVGMAYNFPSDLWNLQLLWTRLHTRASSEASGLVGGGGDFTLSHEKIVWKLHYDIVDLTLDKSICICESFSLKPFIGIRYARLNQLLELDLTARDSGESVFESINTPLWGMGGLIGLNIDWKLGCGFKFFGMGSVSQLLGRSNARVMAPDTPTFDQEGPVSIKRNKAFSSLDSAIGISWQTPPSCLYVVDFQLAWESHTYFNIIVAGGDLDVGDINLHGVTFTANLQF